MRRKPGYSAPALRSRRIRPIKPGSRSASALPRSPKNSAILFRIHQREIQTCLALSRHSPRSCFLLEGRDTGSEGLRKAEAYAVEQFQKAGLQPAGSDGFYQRIEFTQYEMDEAKSSLTLLSPGAPETHLSFADDAFFSTRTTHASTSVTAPMIFAGYGLTVPENKLDELAGLDLKGKIIVYIAGSPSDIPTQLASHYQTLAERWKFLKAAGVIGVVSLINPASMDIPWSRISVNRNHPSMDLADPEFNETEGLKFGVTVNPASAEKFFVGSGHTFAEIAALAKDRKPLPHFALAASLHAEATVLSHKLQSANVVAKLPGSDPTLKDEYVVLSAHIDHIGIGAPINGDKIYNGAMDNGSGSALAMDIAAHLKAHPEKLGRSLLFVLVTAEEKGLLGSKYFAAHPTVPAKSIVADVNVDMFLPIIRSRRTHRRHRQLVRRQSRSRSRTAAQSFYPQRSIQFHSPRHSLRGLQRLL